MKAITFRFGSICSIEDFAATMSRIQASPSVEMVKSVKCEGDLTEQTAMFTAILFDDADEAEIRRKLSSMPGIELVAKAPVA